MWLLLLSIHADVGGDPGANGRGFELVGVEWRLVMREGREGEYTAAAGMAAAVVLFAAE
jgi:hypothetical protein